jgi:hypothetical protein
MKEYLYAMLDKLDSSNGKCLYKWQLFDIAKELGIIEDLDKEWYEWHNKEKK